MTRALPATALALLCAAAPALATERLKLESLEDISHEVVYVNAFGRWREGGHSGYHRVILLDVDNEHPHSRLYLQWIAESEQAGDRVMGSTAVAEVNNSGVYKLSIPRIKRVAERAVSVEVTAVNQYTRNVQQLEISPRAVSEYTLEFASDGDLAAVDRAVGDIPLNLDYYSRPTF
ncbi:MAG: hypothetical protein R3228_04260 [Halioglobus sp.]|nr:hypothetical protein [Halioglobus sp.]